MSNTSDVDRASSEPPGQAGAMLRRRELLGRGAAGAGLMLGGGLISACGAGTKSSKPVGTVGGDVGSGKKLSLLTFGVEYDAGSMDYTQSYAFSDLLVVPSMTEPLLRIDANGQLTPNLATSWDLSDPLRTVFHIRPSVRFWDGSPLTADDVAFSMSRHMDPAVASLLGFYYARVARVEATGPLEVTAFMKAPDVQFHEAMATNAGAVSSKSFIQAHGKSFGTPRVGTMGTGPYRYVNWVKGQAFTVERSAEYWNTTLPRKVERFTAHVITDEATLLAALRAGQIDGSIQFLSGRGVQSLATASNIAQYRVVSDGGSHMSFNVAKKPWNDPRVREAISLVIPRQGLLDSVWGNQATIVKSVITPPMWRYAAADFQAAYAALPAYVDTDVAHARSLIRAAGAHGARGKIWVSSNYDAQQAEAIQAAAAQIGLQLSPNMVPQATLTAAQTAKTKPYEMQITIWQADLPDPANTYEALYAANSVQNYGGYNDPRVQALLSRQSRLTTDPNTRAQLIAQAQSVIVGQQWDPVLVSPYTVLTLNRRVGGYRLQQQWYWDPQFIGSFSGR